MSVSSEYAVQRFFGDEILDHSRSAVQLDFFGSGNAPLLLDHDERKQIGVVESVTLSDSERKLRAIVRFGKGALADEVFQDVIDGIRRNTSVQYRINEYIPLPGDAGYRITKWTPLEVSIVSIPADPSVGVGRSAEIIPETSKPKGTVMDPEELARREAEITARQNEAALAEARGRAIGDALEIAARHNMRDAVDTFLTPTIRAQSPDAILAAVRGFILERLPTDRPMVDERVGMNVREQRRFSLMRLIRAIDPQADTLARNAARFELEACQAAAEKADELGLRSQTGGNGTRLPAEIMLNWATNQRVLNVVDDAALVPTDYLAGSFIDLLRKRSSVMRAGVTMLNGLSGNVDIPRQATASVATWVSAEHNDATITEPTFDKISLTPKDLAAYVDMTRRMTQQASPDIEALVRNDIMMAFALGLDATALEGSGTGGIPRGVRNVVGINRPTPFAAANPTWAEIVALETMLDDDEALLGNLAYIGRTSMRGAFKTTLKSAGVSGYIMETNGSELNGYPYIASNQGTAGNLYFGNWSDVLIGMWSGIELVADRAALALKGGLRLIAFQTADVQVRHPESFAWNKFGA